MQKPCARLGGCSQQLAAGALSCCGRGSLSDRQAQHAHAQGPATRPEAQSPGETLPQGPGTEVPRAAPLAEAAGVGQPGSRVGRGPALRCRTVQPSR